MFGLGIGEITIILLLALIFIGPKRLPEVGRKLGEFYRQFRDVADTMRSTITEEFEEPSETEKVPPPAKHDTEPAKESDADHGTK